MIKEVGAVTPIHDIQAVRKLTGNLLQQGRARDSDYKQCMRAWNIKVDVFVEGRYPDMAGAARIGFPPS